MKNISLTNLFILSTLKYFIHTKKDENLFSFGYNTGIRCIDNFCLEHKIRTKIHKNQLIFYLKLFISSNICAKEFFTIEYFEQDNEESAKDSQIIVTFSDYLSIFDNEKVIEFYDGFISNINSILNEVKITKVSSTNRTIIYSVS